jgi:hypothetical protein
MICPEPFESSPHPDTLFNTDVNIPFQFVPTCSGCSLPWKFCDIRNIPKIFSLTLFLIAYNKICPNKQKIGLILNNAI